MSFRYDREQNKIDKKIYHSKFRVTTSLIAGILLSLNPIYNVDAEKVEDSDKENDVKELQAEYHSLLNNFANDEISSENDAESKEEYWNKLDKEYVKDYEELNIVKENLFVAIEKVASFELVKELKEKDLTIVELDEIFERLIEESISKENNSVNQEEKRQEHIEVQEHSEVLDKSEKEEHDKNEIKVEKEVIREEEQETEVTTEKTTQELEIKATEATEATNQESVKQDYSKEIKSVNLVGLNDKLPDEDKLVYVVKSGDTLNKIAKVHNTTVEKLLSINHLKNPNIIRVGQEIIIYSDGEQLDNLSKPQTKLGFVEVLSEYAEVVAQEQNLYASVMIAQASLETGFGKSSLSTEPNHNLYGMKGSYQGQSVVMRTKEYSPAKGWYYINAHFKKYPSYLESLIDHALYIRKGVSWNSNYYSGVWRENTNSYKDATAWLQGRYATDPNYAAKLNNIIEKYDLTRYDYEKNADSTEPEEDSSSGNNNVEKPVTPSTGGKEENTVIYKVKKGDTLSHIARAYKTTVRELKSINNLKTDLIIVGQELQIGKKNVAESKPNPKPEEKPNIDASKVYKVKKGDTLSHIARAHKTTVRELKSINNLKSDLIIVGQKLQIGKKNVAESKPNPKPAEKPSVDASKVYKVKKGDTLSHIARAHKTTVRELKSLNNLKTDLIIVGQKLQIGKKNVAESNPKPEEKPSVDASKVYKVKKGDTLSHIARAYKTTVRELKSLNNLKTDLIFVGQNIKIEANDTVEKPRNSISTNYIVKKGDTLYHIALKNNTSVKDIKEKNKLRSDLIIVGQKLKL